MYFAKSVILFWNEKKKRFIFKKIIKLNNTEFIELRWRVIVPFLDIGGTGDHYCTKVLVIEQTLNYDRYIYSCMDFFAIFPPPPSILKKLGQKKPKPTLT